MSWSPPPGIGDFLERYQEIFSIARHAAQEQLRLTAGLRDRAGRPTAATHAVSRGRGGGHAAVPADEDSVFFMATRDALRELAQNPVQRAAADAAAARLQPKPLRAFLREEALVRDARSTAADEARMLRYDVTEAHMESQEEARARDAAAEARMLRYYVREAHMELQEEARARDAAAPPPRASLRPTLLPPPLEGRGWWPSPEVRQAAAAMDNLPPPREPREETEDEEEDQWAAVETALAAETASSDSRNDNVIDSDSGSEARAARDQGDDDERCRR